jgi:hypothetical protein
LREFHTQTDSTQPVMDADVEMDDGTLVEESDGGDGVFVDDDESDVEWPPAKTRKIK